MNIDTFKQAQSLNSQISRIKNDIEAISESKKITDLYSLYGEIDISIFNTFKNGLLEYFESKLSELKAEFELL